MRPVPQRLYYEEVLHLGRGSRGPYWLNGSDGVFRLVCITDGGYGSRLMHSS
jgi:hypothetical protein